MYFYHYARDFYAYSKAQQLRVEAAITFIAIVFAFIGIHMLRRSFGQPLSTEYGWKLPQEKYVRRYEVGARLYHWSNLVVLAGLVTTGTLLFLPTSFWEVPWLIIHEIFAGLFVVGLAFHIIIAPRRGCVRAMWFEKRDWLDLKLIFANFFGRTRQYPAFGKYDPFQKLYHLSITMLSFAVIFSGIFLVLSAQVWLTFSHEWMRIMRLMHDIAAFVFVAIIIGHIYFGLMRVNWPYLVAMITGRLKGSFYNRYHDTSRWEPKDERN